MDRLGHLLPQTLRKHGLQKQAHAALLCHLAEQWLRDHVAPLARSVRFISFRDGVLTAGCQTSIAAQELRQAEAQLLQALLHLTGQEVRQLRISRDE